MHSSSDVNILAPLYFNLGILKAMTYLIKTIVILFLLSIFFALGSALYYLVNERGQSTRIVKALTWRIGLSFILFIFLLFAFAMGWVTPHTFFCNTLAEAHMGLRNFGSLIIIFLILMMIFGTQRLRDVGNDLAAAIRSFRKGLQDEEEGKKE